MTITQNETQAGAIALKTYIDRMLTANGLAWEEVFIPDEAYTGGANDVIGAADGAEDQSQQGRLTAGVEALRAAIESVGQSDKVSDTNLIEAAGEILTAVAKVRAQENPPQKPQTVPQYANPPGDDPQGDHPNAPADPNADQSGADQTGVAGNSDPNQSPQSESADA